MVILRLAIPSDGELYESTLGFLRSSGIFVERSSPRRYTASIRGMPNTIVMFQRTGDIPSKVKEGSVDLGVTGLDRYLEMGVDLGGSSLVMEDLGYSKCELVVAVPDSWVDVTSVDDLVDLSVTFREQGREFRIATKYPNLVQRHFFNRGVNYFSMVESSGTLEAAPAMGFADMIADISASGTTLRENRLKTITGGSILSSQACIVGNRSNIGLDSESLKDARYLLEHIEGYIRSKEFFSITSNIKTDSPDSTAGQIREKPWISGLKGPTIAKVYTADGESWYSVTVVVPTHRLIEAIDSLRQAGGETITVDQPRYVFLSQGQAYDAWMRE